VVTVTRGPCEAIGPACRVDGGRHDCKQAVRVGKHQGSLPRL